MSEKPLSYGKTVAVFRELFNANAKKLQSMIGFSEKYAQSMDRLVNKVTRPFAEKTFKKNPPNPSSFHKNLIDMCYSSMNFAKPFAQMAPVLDGNLTSQLKTISEEYSSSGSALLSSIEAALKDVKKAGKAAQAAHKEYRQVGAAIVQRFENNQQKPVEEDQPLFLEKQNAAMEAHKLWNEKRVAFNLAMEQFITDFENLEKERYVRIQALMSDFADFFESFGSKMIAFGESLSSRIDEINMDQEQSDLTAAVAKVKQVETDDKYQLIPIPQSGSKYFIWKDVYKDEMKKGACLKKVTEDRYGGCEELMVKQGEVVLVVGEEKGMCRCRNVNASIGLVPKEILVDVA